MSYTVLARKYRPQTFADLVGQEHVSRTLENAIKAERVAHAFLFTGARGVGKTTTARLLAKALNCERGPSGTPCNECDACREIAQGVDMDVMEIDGASNNSVDDVRRLQESLPYRPARDRFKIVIVDEVHMLSTGAFNAFLKTLEEPPPHVKFIFATTEMHKVPITIRSRCQRHDFRLIPRSVVAARTREILQTEGIEADDSAIALVAREAAGSMRDALTVLDQLLAFGGGSLKGEEAAHALGIADRKRVLGVCEALLSGDAASCLREVAALGEQGLDVLHFGRQLLSLMRDLSVLRVVGDDHELIELVDEERQSALALAGAHSPQQIERAFAGLNKLMEEVALSASPQLTLEMGLLRLCDRAPLEPLSELIARLKVLEGRLGPAGGAASGGSPSGGARGSAGGSGGRDRPGGARSAAPETASAAAMESRGAAPPPRPSTPAASPPSSSRTAAPLVSTPAAHAAEAAKAPSPAQPAVRREAEAPSPAPAPPNSDELEDAPELAGIPLEWTRIVTRLSHSQPALGAVLEHGVASQIDAQRLVVRFPEGSFFGRQAASQVARQALAEAAEAVLGRRPAVEIAFGKEAGSTMAEERAAEREKRRAAAAQDALNHPRVRDALEVFPESAGSVDVQVDLE